MITKACTVAMDGLSISICSKSRALELKNSSISAGRPGWVLVVRHEPEAQLESKRSVMTNVSETPTYMAFIKVSE